MALNILTILATSNDCEQAFSKTSDLLELYHLRLCPDIITTLQYNCSYKKIGFKRSSISNKFAIIYIEKANI